MRAKCRAINVLPVVALAAAGWSRSDDGSPAVDAFLAQDGTSPNDLTIAALTTLFPQ